MTATEDEPLGWAISSLDAASAAAWEHAEAFEEVHWQAVICLLLSSIYQVLTSARQTPALDDCSDELLRDLGTDLFHVQVETILLSAALGLDQATWSAGREGLLERILDDLERIEDVSDEERWAAIAFERVAEIAWKDHVWRDQHSDPDDDHRASAIDAPIAVYSLTSWAIAREVFLRVFYTYRQSGS